MNKKFSYILISLCMLGVLLAPITPVIQLKSEGIAVELKQNKSLAQVDAQDTDLLKEMEDCGFGVFGSSSIVGCFVIILYFVGVSVPSFLMGYTASFFDYMATLTISSNLYEGSFIQKIWQIVRDFANIFFILILLYAAFNIILGIGSGGGKKTVALVIVIALLVNFSLFTSKVIIDSSNVLALIFYNKISCMRQDGKECGTKPIADSSKTGISQRSISTALVSHFDINAFYTGEFLRNLQGTDVVTSSKLPRALAISLIFMYAIVAYSLTWIFLVVGLSFLGRMLTLMLLMIVSPLAFVTYAVPSFRNTPTIGFDKWIHELIKTSFMAVVFMAILYVVSEILKADIFDAYAINGGPTDTLGRLVLLFTPAVMIVMLLKKGSSYAQEASGAVTGAILGGATAIGGLALGVATGGAALVGRKFIGGYAMNMANNDQLKKDALAGDKGAQRKLALANSISKSSFDFRQTSAGKYVSRNGGLGKGGMNMESGAGLMGLSSDKFKGGRAEQAKRTLEKDEKRIKSYQLSPAAEEEQERRAKDEKDPQNIRAEEYKNDKRKAEENAKESVNAREIYENKYKEAVIEFETKYGAKIKEGDDVFRKNYEQTHPVPPPIITFDETTFKEAYKEGKNEELKKFGIDKDKEYKEAGRTDVFGEGSVDKVRTAKEENAERRKAYILSLDKKAEKEEKAGVMRSMWQNYKEGVASDFKAAASTQLGAVASVGALAATGGAAILVPFATNFIKVLKNELSVKSTDSEIRASLRKGVVDPKAKVLEDMKKVLEEEGGGNKKKEEKKEEPKPEK